MSKQIKLTDFDNGSQLTILVIKKVDLDSFKISAELPPIVEVPETTVEVQPC